MRDGDETPSPLNVSVGLRKLPPVSPASAPPQDATTADEFLARAEERVVSVRRIKGLPESVIALTGDMRRVLNAVLLLRSAVKGFKSGPIAALALTAERALEGTLFDPNEILRECGLEPPRPVPYPRFKRKR